MKLFGKIEEVDSHSRDEWIREELIPRITKHLVLWVISGREKLDGKQVTIRMEMNLCSSR